MNTPCTRLHLFVDGELSTAEADAFRQHLTRCVECETGLRDLLQLEMLAARALGTAGSEQPQKVTQLRPWMHKVYRAAMPVALAAGLAAVGVMRLQAEPPLPDEVWLASADSRTLEARLSHPKANRFLPFNPMRGGAQTADPLPLRPLAELEERQDFRGIAAAYALRGDWQQAEAFLARAPESADKNNDRAVVALNRAQWEEALGLLSGALRQEPAHPQALWNRGLALRGLGLPKRAEETFRRVAELEPVDGWRQEAVRKADELRDEWQGDEAKWAQQVKEARQALAKGTDEAGAQQLARQPAVARAALYESVRTATTPDAVKALLPLAQALDRTGGGTVLQDYVKDTAARDFGVRAPLAREYAKLLDGGASPGLLDMLRRSEELDLYFGALLHTGEAVKDGEALKALQRFAHASRDPWLHLLVERERARGEDAAGRAESAEQLLVATLRTCRAFSPQFRCAEIH